MELIFQQIELIFILMELILNTQLHFEIHT